MRLDNLDKVCRAAGLKVVEEHGWKNRGDDFAAKPSVVVAHHTASNRRGGNFPSRNVLIFGRSDLRGPLCQVGLARDGTVHIIAAGKANHAGPGRWRRRANGTYRYTSSEQTIGIEAENDGVGEPWSAEQLDAYDRLAAALLRELGQPAKNLCGHREWATPKGRKIDPTGINMRKMRRRVRKLLRTHKTLLVIRLRRRIRKLRKSLKSS